MFKSGKYKIVKNLTYSKIVTTVVEMHEQKCVVDVIVYILHRSLI